MQRLMNSLNLGGTWGYPAEELVYMKTAEDELTLVMGDPESDGHVMTIKVMRSLGMECKVELNVKFMDGQAGLGKTRPTNFEFGRGVYQENSANGKYGWGEK